MSSIPTPSPSLQPPSPPPPPPSSQLRRGYSVAAAEEEPQVIGPPPSLSEAEVAKMRDSIVELGMATERMADELNALSGTREAHGTAAGTRGAAA